MPQSIQVQVPSNTETVLLMAFEVAIKRLRIANSNTPQT